VTRRVTLGWALCLVAGCAGTETGNPVASKKVSLTVHSSKPDVVAISSSTQGTVIDQAWVAFGHFAFLRDGECGQIANFMHMGGAAIVGDLAQARLHLEVSVEPRAYCGMVAPLENANPTLPKAAPVELHDHSIVVLGHRGDGVPFTLSYPQLDELELQPPTSPSFEVKAEGPPLLLAFDAAGWMNGVDLAQATLAQDGSIRIDEGENPALLLVFENNIDCSLELYSDVDGSSDLSASDRLVARCAPN
jgi:hypothetical protein